MIDYSQILPNLYIGSGPATLEDILELQSLGVTAVLSLQTDEDLRGSGIDWTFLQGMGRGADP